MSVSVDVDVCTRACEHICMCMSKPELDTGGRTLVLRLVCKQSIPGAVSRAEACLCIQTQVFPFLKTHRDYTPVFSSLSTWANVINLIVQTQEDAQVTALLGHVELNLTSI